MNKIFKLFNTILKYIIFGFRCVGKLFFWRRLPREQRKTTVIAASFVLIPLLVLIVFTLINAKKSEAAWVDDSFIYRQRIDVTNAGSAQTDFQVSITLDTASLITNGKMLSNCNDIRIVDQTGKVLPHVIEEGSAACNTATTKIWTKVASIPTTAITLWIYYGNPNAANVENGNSVFAFYDNFNSGSLDTTKWSQTGASSISGGAITITTGSVYTANPLNIDSRSYMYEYREKIATTQTSFTGLMVANASGTAGGNGNSNKLIYMMTNANTSIDMKGWAADGTAASYNLATNAALYTPTANTYYIDGFSMDTTQIKFWNNGSQTGSTVTGSWSANSYLWMGYLLGSNSSTSDMTDITVDWVRVRKYAATAPSVASPTSEEVGPGPVAYWRFDEGGGTITNDSARSSKGTLSGSTLPSWQQKESCISNSCLYFDGSNSYVSVSTMSASLAARNNFTISAWVKRSGTSGTGTIISRYNANVAGEWQVNIDQTTGILNVHREVAPFSHNFNTAIAVGEWHHFEATYDGSNMRLYLDGRLDATISDTGSATSALSTTVLIGASQSSSSPTNFFKGYIDDLKVYPYARTSDQVKLDYNSKGGSAAPGSGQIQGATDQSPLSNGQLAYWKMDEASWNGTSGEVIDSAGSGNNGTLNGQASLGTTTPTSGTASVITKTAAGWTVNAFTNFIVEITSGAGAPLGDNRAVTSNTATTITVSPAFSGSVGTRTFVVRQNWRGKFGNAGIYNGVNNFVSVANTVSGIKGVSFWVKPTSTTTSLIDLNGTAYVTASSGTVSATGFTNPSIYVNGALNGTITANTWNHVVVTTTSSITGSAITIGKANSAFLSGQIDEVRLYNRTLTPGDASQIYNYSPGPIGSWNFEQGSGTTAKDISGNGYDATLSSNGSSIPKYIPGKYGKGLKMDGSTNYVLGPSNSAFDALQFTVEAWVYTSDFNQFGGIFEKTASGNLAGGSYQCRLNSNIQFQTLKTGGDFANYHSLTVTPLLAGTINNQWNHIACVYDGATKSIYVNGKLAVTTGYTEIIQPTVDSGKIFIGSDGFSGGTTPEAPLNGNIDDVKFYNYARTAQQIVSDMNGDHPAVGSPIASPLGYWKLDEGYGTKANSSGSIATMSGTLTGGAFWSNEGKFGKAVSFNGTSGYVDLGDQPQLYTRGPFTVSAWVSPGTSTAANQFIFSDFNSGGTTANFSLQLRNADRKFTFFYGDGSDAALSSTQATIGNWYHVVGVYDGTTNKIYINGVLEHTITQTQNRNTDAGGIAVIGKAGTPNVQWYRGKIDEVKYYNYALTADQVKIDMNRQSSQVLGALSDTSSLTGGSTASSSATAENCVPGDSTSCSSPIGKWNFEEGTGTTVNDTSGTGNTGTWSGTTGAQWTTGKIGKGGNFNGSNNRISVTDANSLDLSGNITFEAWINPTDFANDEMVILNKGTNDCGNYQFSIKTAKLAMPSSTKCAFDGTTIGSNSTVTAGVWQHVAAVVNGTTLTYYINGRLTDTISSWSLGVTNATNLYIGGPDPSQGVPAPDWFKGKIDQVQIFTYARSAAQIAWDYNRGAPVAWYKMDECQGTTMYDSSGNRNNGSLTTASSTITTAGTCTDGSSSSARYTGRNGKFNYGLNTDSGDFVTITNTTSTDLGANSYSASIWFKTTNNFSSSAGPLISKYSTGLDEAYPYNIYFNTSNQICFDSSDSLSTNNLCTTKTYNDGNWHNIIAIRNVSTTKVYIYIDGVQVASLTDATSGASLVSGIDTLIGKATFGLTARYFVGQMDEARFYNYALTQIQIKTLYNNGAVQYAPITGTP